jgi:hypothetical protein
LAEPAAALVESPQFLTKSAPRSKWPWLLAWAAAVFVAIILGLRYFVLTPHAEPLALSVIERNGQLQIAWNHIARPVASAARGSLIVTDGQAPRTFPLTPQDLERGLFNYQRTSDNVEVRMSVENNAGEKVEETTTFLGVAPAKAENDEKLKAIESERDELKAEVERLERSKAEQAERIQQLERNLKILQSRLGAQ